MTIQLYNTLKRAKEDFKPIDEDRVRMYVCGPTVYDYAHIGNARPVVVFDVLYRLLRELYGEDHVIYARNITDVDDKIINRAQDSGESISDITKRTEKAFLDDMGALNAMHPDVQPRATEHIAGMITMIGKLIAAGHAYEAEGHVLFDVPSFRNYGELSGRNRDEMVAGARVEVAPYKRDPADFVLWKPSEDDVPGWESPWGRGRPGWHIECSAMSEQHLGPTFDIHGGGQDLIFPHHENEIAQSTCAHGGSKYVNYWLHNGYLMAEGEKMSKSLGNFYTVHELLEEHPGEAIRMTLLKTHYRQPLDFRKDGIRDAKKELDEFYLALRNAGVKADVPDHVPAPVLEALGDDINTPKAIAHLFELKTKLNASTDEAEKAKLKGDLLLSGDVLGVLGQDPEAWLRGGTTDEGGLCDADIDDLIEQRKQARADKDFAKSDQIRDDLAAQGIILEDGAGGTTWRRQ
ncbi:cysteine--tRNA ligase [Magnetovibrio sp. PR-2]|uniref:cysteine--tRNA ligase n=1 Tax=Magnetovibrio sp. PR-2 TaxID=3120356 RepID=UPI002FCDF808